MKILIKWIKRRTIQILVMLNPVFREHTIVIAHPSLQQQQRKHISPPRQTRQNWCLCLGSVPHRLVFRGGSTHLPRWEGGERLGPRSTQNERKNFCFNFYLFPPGGFHSVSVLSCLILQPLAISSVNRARVCKIVDDRSININSIYLA